MTVTADLSLFVLCHGGCSSSSFLRAAYTPPLCLSSGSQQPAEVARFLEASSRKKVPLEYGEMEISNDQHVVRVRVTTPPLQSKNRNSHIPQPFMHVHFYVLVLSGNHEVTFPWALLCFISVPCSWVVWGFGPGILTDIWLTVSVLPWHGWLPMTRHIEPGEDERRVPHS